MRRFVTRAMWLAIISVVPEPVAAQRGSRLDGAWTHLATRIVAPDTTIAGPVLSGLGVISGRHFSELFVAPGASGIQQSASPSTAEQKAARWDALIAVSGTVEVRDSSITFRHVEDKDPNMRGASDMRRYRLRGDTLWLTSTSPWQKDSTKVVRTTLTFVRIR